MRVRAKRSNTGKGMFSKVDIHGESPDCTILIRRNEERLTGALFFCFPILAAWGAPSVCDGSRHWENAWTAVPFFLWAVYINVGIYWGVQRIHVSSDRLQFETLFGSKSLDSRYIELARIDHAEIREEWRYVKSRKYLHRRIVFLSGGEIVEETASLSRVDAWRLMYGPFQTLDRSGGNPNDPLATTN
jgi:hypothetical protein